MTTPQPAQATDAATAVPEPATGAILRAISDPGSILPRLEGESVSFWQLRAILERAAPLIAAEALTSLAAELDEWASQFRPDIARSTAYSAANLARVRARALAGEPASTVPAQGDSPGGTGPQEPAQSHEYLSTSCLHAAEPGLEDLHVYCRSTTGSNGATDWVKAPACCKFCGAPCVCPCHAGGVTA